VYAPVICWRRLYMLDFWWILGTSWHLGDVDTSLLHFGDASTTRSVANWRPACRLRMLGRSSSGVENALSSSVLRRWPWQTKVLSPRLSPVKRQLAQSYASTKASIRDSGAIHSHYLMSSCRSMIREVGTTDCGSAPGSRGWRSYVFSS
jgi:hypothetical protein